jgi:hypothetical protein
MLTYPSHPQQHVKQGRWWCCCLVVVGLCTNQGDTGGPEVQEWVGEGENRPLAVGEWRAKSPSCEWYSSVF